MMIFYRYDDHGYGTLDPDIKEMTYELENFTSIAIKNPCHCNIEIVKTNYMQNRIVINGKDNFIDTVQFSVKNDTLNIDIKNTVQTIVEKNENNCITLYVNFDLGEELNVSVGGSGKITTTLPFKNGYLAVGGSGKIYALDFMNVKASVAGSGIIKIKNVRDNSVFSVSGSGNINAELAGGKSEIKIAGSGNVNICEAICDITSAIAGNGNINKGGNANNVEVKIAGSGNFNGEKLTVKNISSKVSGSGNVTVNKINGKFEHRGKNGKIKIIG